MAEETGFHERQIDRTPYTVLWGVVMTVAIVFGVGMFALFQAGTFVRRLHLTVPHFGLPNPAAAIQPAKDQAGNAAKQAGNKAVDDASNAVKQAADQKLNQFLSQ